ncbi:hypothetical protein DXG01_000987 [Tephrocybe rancida]|nr:hypothetical protein DXG01_000987 [Tephrocybe rancida]
MLSTPKQQLVEALGLIDVSNEEELGQSISALLTTVHENAPRIPLSRIAHEISKFNAASSLDPLDTLPVLLSCKDPAAKEILLMIGEFGSAKETVIAIQEAIERMDIKIYGDEEDNELDATRLSYPSQLMILVDLYSACAYNISVDISVLKKMCLGIPRLKSRRKTTSETIMPLLSELENVIRLTGSLASREEASLAQRTLESIYPRLALRSAVAPGWESGEEAISNVTDAYISLKVEIDSVLSTPSLQRMMIFAHSQQSPLVSNNLGKLVPVIVSAIQANWGLDESLSILLHALSPLRAPPRPYLSEEMIHPLFSVISPLSSSHPDHLVRHQAFRILSTLLASCPPPVRLQLVRELAVDEDFPQMCVAAVGLIKEAVLEGISNPPSVFASPSFLDVFGPILFRPSPPNLLADDTLTLDKFQESSEPARLVECLGTYYTILQRDKNNLTRMRNADALHSVEASLLTPLRLALNKLATDPNVGHNFLLGSLQMSIERVDGAIAQLETSTL